MRKIHHKWMYTVLPYAAMSSGLSVILPLYILSLHGTVFDVGVAITAYYAVSIPASVIWGRVIDRIGRPRRLILLSFLGTLPAIFILYIAHGIAYLQFDYGLFALMYTAASPAVNILVMGTRRERTLPRYFSRYSTLSILGAMLAFAAGVFVSYSTIRYYIDFLLVTNLLAAAMSYFFIKDIHLREVGRREVEAVRHTFPILSALGGASRVVTGIMLIKRMHSGLRSVRTRRIYILLAAIALFNFGIILIITSYIPYLRTHGLTYSNIFLLNVLNSIAQMAVYVTVFLFVTRALDPRKHYAPAIAARSVAYVIAIVPLFVLAGAFLQLNLILYILAGFAYAYWNISSSVMVYEHVRGRHEGYYIGMWTALIGLSAVIGAFTSGAVSASLGYTWTYVIAILANVASVLTFRKCW